MKDRNGNPPQSPFGRKGPLSEKEGSIGLSFAKNN
jgi:hypothetical protein